MSIKCFSKGVYKGSIFRVRYGTYHLGRHGLFHAVAWWRHQMETFSALLALCAGNSPVTGEFPSQRPVMRGIDIFFYLRLNKRLSKWRRWWFETPLRSLWRHCNVFLEKVKALKQHLEFYIVITHDFAVHCDISTEMRVTEFVQNKDISGIYWQPYCFARSQHPV